MNDFEMLKEYARLAAVVNDAQSVMSKLRETLNVRVGESGGDVKAFGLHAYMKPGRKRIDHEAAVKFNNIDQSIIDDNSTTKTTVKWAAITKSEKLSIDEYTTIGKATFVIESE